MAVTLQQIAELAGVSRRTVDRALNDKGRIKPEVAEKIKRIAKELNYQPSRAGRALVMAKKNLKIGVILQSAKTPFMRDVLNGLEAAKKEIESLGAAVEIKKIDGVDPIEVINLMKQMRSDSVNGIAISPSENKHLAAVINEFVRQDGIPVATFNSDLAGTDRLCFVGQDTVRAGQTAAGLMASLTDRQGELVILCGHRENPALINRIDGFIREIEQSYPKMKIVDMKYYYDDDWIAETIADEMLKQHPSLKGFYVTGCATGVCKSLEHNKAVYKIKIVAHDLIRDNIHWLKRGDIDFLIGQNAYEQGYKAVMSVFKKVLDGTDPSDRFQYTDIVIKNKYNI